MLMDSPEFLEALGVLNTTILEESNTTGLIDDDKRQVLESGVRESLQAIQEKRKSELSARFRKLHLLRSSARERSMNRGYQGPSSSGSSRSGGAGGGGGERVVVSPLEEAGMRT